MTFSNRVHEYRAGQQLSQTQLAKQIGITRQALRLIETGDVVPSALIALRLARAFGISVEELFFEGPDICLETVTVWAGDEVQTGDRVVVADIDGRRIGRSVMGAHAQQTQAVPFTAVVHSRLDEERVHVERPPRRPTPDSFLVAGCDLGLGLLAEHLHNASTSSTNTLWIGVDNTQALRQLAEGAVHVAAVHMPMGTPAPYTPEDVVRIHFADWEVGWMVRRGNSRQFHGVDDLRTGSFRLINRSVGSGVRTLLDSLMESVAVAPSAVPQYDCTVGGHRQVAESIASGVADVGIGIASAAALFHLDFIPIRQERCEIWIPQQRFGTPQVQQLLNALHSDAFRWDLERFGPCDVAKTGQGVET